MEIIIKDFGIVLCGYLCGSLPFSIWVTKRIKGVDVRHAGSKHATTTNTIRQAGWAAGALVLILDILKGFVPTVLAIKYSQFYWVIPLTASLAVAGHCWPIFAQFRGGMGLATSGGCLLALTLVPSLVVLAVLIALTLIIRHSARAALFTGLLIGPIFFLTGERGQILIAAFGIGVVIAVRFYSDWRREYRELWLDREINSSKNEQHKIN